MNICVFASSYDCLDPVFVEDAEKLGREIARRGHKLLYGGGRCGLMGATARAALEAGGEVVGIVPELFNIDGGQLDGLTEFIRTKSMSARKQSLIEMADAFVALPGGIGTFDELFETLTLLGLGEFDKPIALQNTSRFYTPLMTVLKNMAQKGFISREVMEEIFVSSVVSKVVAHCERTDIRV